MRSAAKVVAIAATLAVGNLGSAHAQVRATADISCKPGPQKLQYDCVIKVANARTNEPLSGLTLTIGADMPSMPGVHSVRPAVATEDSDKGTYRAHITLEMHGDWALQLNLSGAMRDRVVKVLRFEGDRVGEAVPARKHGPHKH
jgi:YtkA-like